MTPADGTRNLAENRRAQILTGNLAPTVWAGRVRTPRRKQPIVAVERGLFVTDVKGLERLFDVVAGLVANPEVDRIIATVGLWKNAEQ